MEVIWDGGGRGGVIHDRRWDRCWDRRWDRRAIGIGRIGWSATGTGQSWIGGCTLGLSGSNNGWRWGQSSPVIPSIIHLHSAIIATRRRRMIHHRRFIPRHHLSIARLSHFRVNTGHIAPVLHCLRGRARRRECWCDFWQGLEGVGVGPRALCFLCWLRLLLVLFLLLLLLLLLLGLLLANGVSLKLLFLRRRMVLHVRVIILQRGRLLRLLDLLHLLGLGLVRLIFVHGLVILSFYDYGLRRRRLGRPRRRFNFKIGVSIYHLFAFVVAGGFHFNLGGALVLVGDIGGVGR
mmetsp:Transcript_26431/g.55818  ORF Transcript_26431/g.55818 Transcript_26431/m.55818 type:complete len:292 (-) Transcript_26431:651-1526(-)